MTIGVQLRVAAVLEQRIVEFEADAAIRGCQVRYGRDECGRRSTLPSFGRSQVRLRFRRADR